MSNSLKIPYTKAHGARNDFLLTWQSDLPNELARDHATLTRLAVAICARHTGVGADGWILISGELGSANVSPADAVIELWNSDGSRSEISGNGTRCAAARMVAATHNTQVVRIATGAGVKVLTLLQRDDLRYSFEMNMGSARIEELESQLVPGRDAVILNVGNPQIAVFVDNFDFDWRTLGAKLERDPHFPNRTNVSFVQVLDDHTIDVRFFERGAGETMSSGTGSTGAVAASIARGKVRSPVEVRTPAGPLRLRVSDHGEYLLTGPAEIVATGDFYWDPARG